VPVTPSMDGTDRPTDGRTPDRYIDPAVRTMQAASRTLMLCVVDDGLDNFEVGLSDVFPAEGTAVSADSYTLCGAHSGTVGLAESVVVKCDSVSQPFRYIVVRSSDATRERLCMAEVEVYGAYWWRRSTVMLQRLQRLSELATVSK